MTSCLYCWKPSPADILVGRTAQAAESEDARLVNAEPCILGWCLSGQRINPYYYSYIITDTCNLVTYSC